MDERLKVYEEKMTKSYDSMIRDFTSIRACLLYTSGFFFRVHDHADAVLVAFRIGVLADEGQLFQLGDGVAAVGHQLTEENVVIGIQPFFNNRKNIFAVDGKTSMLICHCNSLLHRKGCPYRSVSAARFCSVSHCNSPDLKSQ